MEDEIPNILNLVKEGRVLENQIKDVLLKLVKGKTLKEAVKFETVDVNEIEEKIIKMLNEKPGLSEKAYMGLIMKEMQGKISGKDVMEMIKKFVD